MSDVTDRLNTLKAQIEQGKMEKAKATANLDVYTKQKEELVKQLTEMGVTPETLDAEIAKLDQEIAAGLDQAEALLKGGE
jgi:chromosome segregation ATPase